MLITRECRYILQMFVRICEVSIDNMSNARAISYHRAIKDATVTISGANSFIFTFSDIKNRRKLKFI